MKNLFGVMQGRLLPKYMGQYQAHPVNYWEKEFEIAKNINLDCIEFIFDFNDYLNNPLITEAGNAKIKNMVNLTGVSVESVCADYFMKSPIHSLNDADADYNIEIFFKLINHLSKLKIKNVVLPCVDNTSLKNKYDRDRFIEVMSNIMIKSKDFNINIALETDLDPKEFVELLNILDSKNITVNYDIGNSASLNYSFIDELSAYGEKISDIHIKDRKLAGGPVVLGEGNADIKGFFDHLKKLNYKGLFIMQAYRDEEGINIFQKQKKWLFDNTDYFK